MDITKATKKEFEKYCLLAQAMSYTVGDIQLHLIYLFMEKNWKFKEITIGFNWVKLILNEQDEMIYIRKEHVLIHPNTYGYRLSLSYFKTDGEPTRFFQQEYDGTLEGAYTALILLDDDLNEYLVDKEIDEAFNSKFNPKPEIDPELLKTVQSNLTLDF